MRADLLLSGRLDAWLAPAEPPPLWLFVHVPKTAGSSLVADLEDVVPHYRSIHIDHTDRSRPGPERYDIATEEFLRVQGTSPARIASGHVQWRQVARIIAGVPGVRLVTMLREPKARLVSDYLYQRSPMHPLADEVKSRIPDFDAFLELKGQRNRTARHLVPKRLIDEGDPGPILAHIRARFAFVGIQERYELCFRALTARLGRQMRPTARKRVNDGAAEEKAAALARLEVPEVQARLAELNAVDLAIYEDVARAWDAIATQMSERLDAEMVGV
jgi:hypothetical protein